MKLFNILFDESFDLKLEKATVIDIRLKNWNKINGIFKSIIFSSLGLLLLSLIVIPLS